MDNLEPGQTHRRRTGIAALVLGLIFVVGYATPSASAAADYKKDLYFSGGYERQVDNRTCMAASTAMMLNFIARRDLDLGQLYMLRWAQTRDALVRLAAAGHRSRSAGRGC